jgi:hypothetical protein
VAGRTQHSADFGRSESALIAVFMAFMSLVIVASAPLFGGSLSRLTGIRLRYTWLVVLALGLQVLITEVITGAPRPLLISLHLESYVMVAFVLWSNRALPGLLVLGTGGMLNAVVIALNDGTLPASARALRQAGFATTSTDFANSGVLAHPILPWFGDLIATPSWLPFRNVMSIGDVLALLGAAILMHQVCESRLARRPLTGPEPLGTISPLASTH